MFMAFGNPGITQTITYMKKQMTVQAWNKLAEW